MTAISPRPCDAEGRVVVAQAALGAGGVGIGDEVGRLGVVLERQVAVGEALGHVEHPAVLRGELEALPPAAGGRVGAQVDDGVEERAAGAAHHLHLGVGAFWKCMPRSVPACGVGRGVLLHEAGGEAVGGELLLAEGAGEPAAAGPRGARARSGRRPRGWWAGNAWARGLRRTGQGQRRAGAYPGKAGERSPRRVRARRGAAGLQRQCDGEWAGGPGLRADFTRETKLIRLI